MSRAPRPVVAALVCLLAVGCTADQPPPDAADRIASSAQSAGPSAGPSAGRSASPVTTSPATPAATPTPSSTTHQRRTPRRVRGIDASHDQGAIDWGAVAADGIRFAYLKATEGRGFTDPRFVEHRERAVAAGLRVGGYHYYSLCSPAAEQAEHFTRVLGDLSGPGHLPPAVDLELGGNCSPPPDRAILLSAVREFLALVEERTGRRPVVYLYPELEVHYDLARGLAGRQWVRRLGSAAPERTWWIWQYDDAGTVAGVVGPVDLNVMKVR